jgi:hypothetical protein
MFLAILLYLVPKLLIAVTYWKYISFMDPKVAWVLNFMIQNGAQFLIYCSLFSVDARSTMSFFTLRKWIIIFVAISSTLNNVCIPLALIGDGTAVYYGLPYFVVQYFLTFRVCMFFRGKLGPHASSALQLYTPQYKFRVSVLSLMIIVPSFCQFLPRVAVAIIDNISVLVTSKSYIFCIHVAAHSVFFCAGNWLLYFFHHDNRSNYPDDDQSSSDSSSFESYTGSIETDVPSSTDTIGEPSDSRDFDIFLDLS